VALAGNVDAAISGLLASIICSSRQIALLLSAGLPLRLPAEEAQTDNQMPETPLLHRPPIIPPQAPAQPRVTGSSATVPGEVT
jgi:hypothetical protein